MINVAVIGFGFMGITHSQSILRNKRLDLRAIITRNALAIPARLNEQIGNFSSGETDLAALSNVPVYSSLRECLKKEKIDAVHVCVHTNLHYDIAREAMDAGIHVFLEKPISLHIEEAELLIHYAKQQGVKFMVGHVVRFMPPYIRLKQWINSAEYGALEFISLTRFSGLPSWGQWTEKRKIFGSTGGALFDLVIHDIDFLNYVLGVPGKIKAVCLPGALSMHDYITAYWYYGNVCAKIEGGNIFHPTFPFQAGYMARFEHASVLYSSQLPESIRVCLPEGVVDVAAGDANDGFFAEIDYFASCIENDTEPVECLPASSLQTIRLCYDHIRD